MLAPSSCASRLLAARRRLLLHLGLFLPCLIHLSCPVASGQGLFGSRLPPSRVAPVAVMSFVPRPLGRLLPGRVDPVTGMLGPTIRYVSLPTGVASSDAPIDQMLSSMELGMGRCVAEPPTSASLSTIVESLAVTGQSTAGGLPPAAVLSAVAGSSTWGALPSAGVKSAAAALSATSPPCNSAALPAAAAESAVAAVPVAARSPSAGGQPAAAVVSTAAALSTALLSSAAAGSATVPCPSVPVASTGAGVPAAESSLARPGSPVTPLGSQSNGGRRSDVGPSSAPREAAHHGSPATPPSSTPTEDSLPASLESGIDAASSAILRSIALLGIELVRSARPPRAVNKVFIVLEYGDGSMDNPYDGRVIDCTTDGSSAEFEAAFKQEWWTKRRPFLSGPKKGGAGDDKTSDEGAAVPGASSSDATCPSFALHSTAALLSIKNSPKGKNVIPANLMANALHSLGLEAVSQLTAVRVRRIFQDISKNLNEPSGGRARWSWSQACPLQILMNEWSVSADGSGDCVQPLCLYPPCHNSVKTKPALRRSALVLAASLSEYWMYFLCKEFSVKWKLGFAFEDVPGILAPLRKKRRGDGVTGQSSKKSKASPGNPAEHTLHKFWWPALGRLSLIAEVAQANAATLGQLSTMAPMPCIGYMDTSSMQHLAVNEQQRSAVELYNKNIGVLLPRDLLTSILEFYPGSGEDVADGSGTSATVQVTCSTIPTLRLTYAGICVMQEAHSVNDDIRLSNETFEWLDELSTSGQLLPPGLGSVLSPAAPVAVIASELRAWLASGRAGVNAWRFFDLAAGPAGGVAGCREYGGLTTTYREIARGCQPTWMTSDVINAALVELRVAARGSKSYVLLSSEMAAMLRIGRHAVILVEAQKAAEEVACEAGDCDKVGLVINLLNQHWVSAFADIENRCITVFDSLAGIQAEEKAVAVGRVKMLCDAVLARRKQSLSPPGQQGSSPWRVIECDAPRQLDTYSCGAFAVAHVACALRGTSLPVGVRGNVLRLALLHNVVSQGRMYESARAANPVVTKAA